MSPRRVLIVAALGALVAVGLVVAMLVGLRGGDPPVLARIRDGALLLDVRTLLDGDEAAVVSALRNALR